jgi:hypothetical protein
MVGRGLPGNRQARAIEDRWCSFRELLNRQRRWRSRRRGIRFLFDWSLNRCTEA